jgi:eukaryotic-like serine/threonine-protein kinase
MGGRGPQALEHDRVLNHFRIVEKIGEGGMGEVYRAYDEHLCRDVAIKVLPPGALADANARKRFRKEALSLSKVNHPNIASVFDFDTHCRIDFLVMEYIPGTTLADKINTGAPLPEDEILSIGVQVAEGLIAAHEQGVIHCDLKPGNLRITPDGRLKILDFGVARLVAPRCDTVATDSLTAMPALGGTVPYLAPEQVRNQPADARTDIWGAGAVLYELATGRTPFHSSSPSSTLAAILECSLVPPSALNPHLTSGLDAILAKALQKDPGLRYQSASELRDDCKLLRQGATLPRGKQSSFTLGGQNTRTALMRAMMLVALVAAMLALIGLWWSRRGGSSGPQTAKRGSIVVLPLHNVSADPNIGFLGIALADEIATELTHTPALEVRPVPIQGAPAADPLETGKKLHVAIVVSGHFMGQGNRLLVTVEAVEIARERLVWRESLSVPAADSMSLQKHLVARVRQALIPALVGGNDRSIESATRPKNAEAYDLFLRSAGMSSDSAPNDAAVAMLERSVALDPNYAPAWVALGLRYYYSSMYGGGGTAATERMVMAHERALRLDPNLVSASARLIRTRVERGDLVKAFREAEDLVRRRPEQAQSHFTRSYVMRYAGLLAEAARECDIALSLDPGNRDFRSCAFAFFEQGKMERAVQYQALDEGSEWFRNMQPSILLRQKKIAEAREAVRTLTAGPPWFAEILQACLGSRRTPEIRDLVHETENDSEYTYYFGTVFALCGQKEPALRLLKSAIERNYCAYAALNSDPALVALRSEPEFSKLRSAGRECQEKFTRATSQYPN